VSERGSLRCGLWVSRIVPPAANAATSGAALCAQVRGVNVHADVAIDGRDRPRLLRLCRYIARPPLAQERLEQLPDGRLRYHMKKRWRDGTHALVFDSLSNVGRLLALVPPPGFHMTRFHGVLAPAAAWRSEVVGTLCAPPRVAAQLTLFDANATPATQAAPNHATAAEQSDAYEGPGRHPWALLLRKTFAVDVTVCGQCGGRMRLLELATTPKAAARALARAGLGPRPPPEPVPIRSAQLTLALS
jgi:hypothetical protein